jgi:hypothetical protein
MHFFVHQMERSASHSSENTRISSPACCRFDKQLMMFILPYTNNYRLARSENDIYIIHDQIATHHTIAKRKDLWKAYWFAFQRSKTHILQILYNELKKRNEYNIN